MKNFPTYLILLTCWLSLPCKAPALEPQWIWSDTQARDSVIDGICLFRKIFSLPAKPTTALLQITCDDQYVVRVNGKLAGVDNDWHEIEQYDVGALLKPGENELFVQARNNAIGPAGLWLRLVITSGEKTTEIVSDPTWSVSVQQAGTWNPDVLQGTNWIPATALGDRHVEPWQAALRLDETVAVVGAGGRASGAFELREGDRVLLLGNTIIEREPRYGHWEAALTTRYPGKHMVLRNLGWSGDTVFGEARARFGSSHEGFDHLEVHVHAVKPTVIIFAYGANAAFAGPSGLASFVAGYEHLLDTLATTGARFVLMAPMPFEAKDPPLPDPTQHNENVRLYAEAVRALAERRKYDFIDLSVALGQGDLTDNGMHLTSAGYWLTAAALERSLGLIPYRWSVAIDVAAGAFDAEGTSLDALEVSPGEVVFEAFDARLRRPFAEVGTHVTGVHADEISQRLRVEGLTAGTYELVVDGAPVLVADAEQWGQGQTFVLPETPQEAALLAAIRKKNELYFHRWRPQNETYLFLFRKHEQGNNAVEIPMFDPLVESTEKQIAELNHPQRKRFVLRRK